MDEGLRKQLLDQSELVNEEMAILWAAGTNIGDAMDKLENRAAFGFHTQLGRLGTAIDRLQELILQAAKG